jgi:DNA invertase Pin-like site-specific DNA recombinase
VNGAVKVTGSHRSRIALIYVRQSSLAQVRDHTEFTARQYALAETAAELGWPGGNVVVIDADLGVSGRSVTARSGFARSWTSADVRSRRIAAHKAEN